MTVTKARKRMQTRRDRYVVGYIMAGNTLYGKGESHTYVSCTDPLSLRQAKARLAGMPCAGAALFELRPIAVNR